MEVEVANANGHGCGGSGCAREEKVYCKESRGYTHTRSHSEAFLVLKKGVVEGLGHTTESPYIMPSWELLGVYGFPEPHFCSDLHTASAARRKQSTTAVYCGCIFRLQSA